MLVVLPMIDQNSDRQTHNKQTYRQKHGQAQKERDNTDSGQTH